MKKDRSDTWQQRMKVDFSAHSALKEPLRDKLLLRLESQPDYCVAKKEAIPMKRALKHTSRIALIAIITVMLMTATALAVTATLSLGPFAHYIAAEEQPTLDEVRAMLDERRADWAGKVFDRHGSPIEDLAGYLEANGEQSLLYDAQGNVQNMVFDDGTFALSPVGQERDFVTRFATMDEARPYACFAFELPGYLPDGYAVSHFEAFNGNNGVPEKGSKYMTAVFTRAGAPGSEIYLSLQLMDEETAFESSGALMREISINGRAAITDEKNIDMLVGDVMYSFMPGKSGVAFEEMVRMAESVPE